MQSASRTGGRRAFRPVLTTVRLLEVPLGPDGLEMVYRASYVRLVAQLTTMTADRSEAEDLVQEAFVRAAQRWDVVGGYEIPEAWVRRVAVNLAVSHLRRLRGHGTAVQRWGHVLSPGENEGPERTSTERLALRAGLGRLPQNYRVVLSLHYLADLDVRRIAALLDVPEATVKTRLARGRARLRSALSDPGRQVPPVPSRVVDPQVVESHDHEQPVDGVGPRGTRAARGRRAA